MKRLSILISILISYQVMAESWHLPEYRTYNQNDLGYLEYNTPSLHYTKQYVLTFDDGPHPIYTPIILDLLKKFNVKATFFILTERLNSKTLPILKRILDEGHIAASHNESHDYSNQLSEKEFESKLTRSLLTLKEYYAKAGHEMNRFYFRFPYAQYGGNPAYHHMNVIQRISQKLFGENCIHFVFWDIDSGDWIPDLTGSELQQNIMVNETGGEYTSYQLKRINGAKVIVKAPKTLESPTQGGVILMHDIQKRTAENLENILQIMLKNNLSIIPLDNAQEFSYDGLTCRFY